MNLIDKIVDWKHCLLSKYENGLDSPGKLCLYRIHSTVSTFAIMIVISVYVISVISVLVHEQKIKRHIIMVLAWIGKIEPRHGVQYVKPGI
jgi:hypothetical protein